MHKSRSPRKQGRDFHAIGRRPESAGVVFGHTSLQHPPQTGRKKQAPKASQVVVKVNGKKLSAKNYKVTIKKGKDAGKYTVTVKVVKGKYKGLKQNTTYTIKKASQKVKVSKSTINVKASKVAKKAVSQKVKVTKKAGKVTYTTNNANITVKKGKIVVAKGTKKGTYKVTVKVKGAKNYKDAKKVITVKVK